MKTNTTTSSTSTAEMAEIEAFEKAYRYDATYMKEMLQSAPEAYQVFARFLPMAQFRWHANPDTYYTAKITAFHCVDCGPCLQLAVRMALESGVSREVIEAILVPEKPLTRVLEEVRLFARTILSGDSNADTLRTKLIGELGESVVVELALAVASAQVFPVVKRAMGHYHSCSMTPLDME